MADGHQRRKVYLGTPDDRRDGPGLGAHGADHYVVEGEVVGWVGLEGCFFCCESVTLSILVLDFALTEFLYFIPVQSTA